MLQALPVELIVQIAEQVDRNRRKDLKSLCGVSKQLHKIVEPVLYKRIVLSPKSGDKRPVTIVDPFSQPSHRSENLFRHTKHFEFSDKFHTSNSYRCCHRGYEGDTIVPIFPQLESNAVSALSRCVDNNLRSFAWKLGTCVPQGLLGESGYLTLHQTGLESLSLITDPFCEDNLDNHDLLHLAPFVNLLKFSWIGLQSDNDGYALGEVLFQVSDQLLELELDFIVLSQEAPDTDRDISNMCPAILGSQTPSERCIYPALEVLSLSHFDFETATMDMVDAFDFRKLRSLRLRRCVGLIEFLRQVISSNPEIGLKSLEIQSSVDTQSQIIEHDLIPEIIGSFQGLEHLGITSPSSQQTLELWRALKQHKSTLKSFVYHQREPLSSTDYADESTVFVGDLDVDDVSLRGLGGLWEAGPSANPLGDLDLEFLGICCAPWLFKDLVLDTMKNNGSLRILHIRQSGVDIKHNGSWGQDVDMARKFWDFDDPDFEGSKKSSAPKVRAGEEDYRPLAACDLYCHLDASFEQLGQKAFGPDGIASLELLVYGDFSHDGRYARNNMVFVRNEDYVHRPDVRDDERPTMSSERTFRFIRRRDRRQHDLLEKYAYALAACPTESILGSFYPIEFL